MDKWIEEWRERYQKLKSSINTTGFNDQLFTELATDCEALLKTWMEMEDKLDDLKELKPEVSKKDENLFNHSTNLQTEGTTYFQLEMFEKSIDVLEEELKRIEPENETVHRLYLGFAHLYEANFNACKESFLYVVHLCTTEIEKHFAYLGLGCLSGRTRQYEEAITYFEKADALYHNPDISYNIGFAFFMLENYSLAIRYLKKTVENNPDDGEALYFLGLSYLKINEEEKAFESWYMALQLLEYKDLLVSIAYEFEKYGYFSAAINCYKRLQSLGYSETWVDHGIAWNNGLLGEKTISKQMFEEILANTPEDTNIWISYLWLLSKWNETNLYNKWFQKSTGDVKEHPLVKKIDNTLTTQYI